MNAGLFGEHPVRERARFGLRKRFGPAEAVAKHRVRVERVGLPVAAAPVAIGVDAARELSAARRQPVRVGDRQHVQLDAFGTCVGVVGEVLEQPTGQLDRIRLRSAVLPAQHQYALRSRSPARTAPAASRLCDMPIVVSLGSANAGCASATAATSPERIAIARMRSMMKSAPAPSTG